MNDATPTGRHDDANQPTGTEAPSCPHWCDQSNDEAVRGLHDGHHQVHPDDAGSYHRRLVDTFMPDHADATDPIRVGIVGYRHDNKPEHDWPDRVEATGDVDPGFMGGVRLNVGDARRLAAALLAACDILEAERP